MNILKKYLYTRGLQLEWTLLSISKRHSVSSFEIRQTKTKYAKKSNQPANQPTPKNKNKTETGAQKCFYKKNI